MDERVSERSAGPSCSQFRGEATGWQKERIALLQRWIAWTSNYHY